MKGNINAKAHVKALYEKALEDCGIQVETQGEGHVFSYYDEEGGYSRRYYFDDTEESVARRILMDSPIEQFLPKEGLVGFLCGFVDPNALMAMERLALIWDDDEGQSPIRDILENDYGDGYAQYIAGDGMLGQTWADRQIPVINVSNVWQSCREIFIPGIDGAFGSFFTKALLQTLFHELRHLFYECNEIVPIEPGTKYPQDGGLEDHVEDYGNAMAYRHLDRFSGIVRKETLEQLEEEK